MYRLVVHPEAVDQITALPDEALSAFAEVLGALELTPWDGPPQNEDNPEGAVRRRTSARPARARWFYLVLEEQREVHVLLVQWLG